jgi:hypothetical protein
LGGDNASLSEEEGDEKEEDELRKLLGPIMKVLENETLDDNDEGGSREGWADRVLAATFASAAVAAASADPEAEEANGSKASLVERDLIQTMVGQIRAALRRQSQDQKERSNAESTSLLWAEHAPRVALCRPETPPYGEPDVVLLRRRGDDHVKDSPARHPKSPHHPPDSPAAEPLLLLQVALHHMYWWNKAHQGIRFLEDMLHGSIGSIGSSSSSSSSSSSEEEVKEERTNTKRIRLSGPAILAVLTVETTESNQFKSGRLGAFLVTPQRTTTTTTAGAGDRDNNDDNFRVCVLSKFQTTPESIENATPPEERLLEMSRALGRVIQAACALPALDAAMTTKPIDFECLGPNCCRIGNKVSQLRTDGAMALRRVVLLTRLLCLRFSRSRSYDPMTVASTAPSAGRMCTFARA